MSESPEIQKPAKVPQVPDLVRELQQVKRERVEGAALEPHLAVLRAWQARRLARTYADFLKSPRYQPAVQFFLDDLYAARDFSQRNRDIKTLHDTLRRIVPESMIKSLTLTVELHNLTESLDAQLLEVLVNRLGMTNPLSVAQYAEAYVLCDNYAERQNQIELICEIVQIVDSVVRLPLSGMVIKLAKGPAERAGWGELMDFLERGYKALQHVHGAKQLVATIHKRELRILDRIYASEDDPFGFPMDEMEKSSGSPI